MKKGKTQWDRAHDLHTLAAEKGFDWATVDPVIEKLKEEIAEFDEAYHSGDQTHALEELGDVLFVCSCLLRKLNSNAETLMQAANDKFQRRFEGISALVQQSGKSWGHFTLDELETFWQTVKQAEKDKLTICS